MNDVTSDDLDRVYSLLKKLAQGQDVTPLIDIANNQITAGKINAQGLVQYATTLGADNLMIIELAGLLRKLAFNRIMIPNIDFKVLGLSAGSTWPTGIQAASDGPLVEIEEWVLDGKGGGYWVTVKR